MWSRRRNFRRLFFGVVAGSIRARCSPPGIRCSPIAPERQAAMAPESLSESRRPGAPGGRPPVAGWRPRARQISIGGGCVQAIPKVRRARPWPKWPARQGSGPIPRFVPACHAQSRPDAWRLPATARRFHRCVALPAAPRRRPPRTGHAGSTPNRMVAGDRSISSCRWGFVLVHCDRPQPWPCEHRRLAQWRRQRPSASVWRAPSPSAGPGRAGCVHRCRAASTASRSW